MKHPEVLSAQLLTSSFLFTTYYTTLLLHKSLHLSTNYTFKIGVLGVRAGGPRGRGARAGGLRPPPPAGD